MAPKLISPSDIIIEQHDVAASVYDDALREPIGPVARTSVTLKAQVSYGSKARVSRTHGGQGGVNNEASGHLVFLQSDLDAAGVTLQRGDRIKKIAQRDVSFYLDNERPGGHWDGTSTLVMWYFTDRRPVEP